MRILVTGASGQLGAYLLRELGSQPDRVVAWSGAQAGERFGVPLRPCFTAPKFRQLPPRPRYQAKFEPSLATGEKQVNSRRLAERIAGSCRT